MATAWRPGSQLTPSVWPQLRASVSPTRRIPSAAVQGRPEANEPLQGRFSPPRPEPEAEPQEPETRPEPLPETRPEPTEVLDAGDEAEPPSQDDPVAVPLPPVTAPLPPPVSTVAILPIDMPELVGGPTAVPPQTPQPLPPPQPRATSVAAPAAQGPQLRRREVDERVERWRRKAATLRRHIGDMQRDLPGSGAYLAPTHSGTQLRVAAEQPAAADAVERPHGDLLPRGRSGGRDLDGTTRDLMATMSSALGLGTLGATLTSLAVTEAASDLSEQPAQLGQLTKLLPDRQPRAPPAAAGSSPMHRTRTSDALLLRLHGPAPDLRPAAAADPGSGARARFSPSVAGSATDCFTDDGSQSTVL
eukprot:TRINITY_DN10632_c1_g1_i1.p2 TRINITY_DN10632_c1_g1~~TRINITY_DN10632_c1_g1_i1.p2  ORF type:complete len:373 (+),score=105.77 TRINITY_DN10632_c1_g1_i1:38-1120(+)